MKVKIYLVISKFSNFFIFRSYIHCSPCTSVWGFSFSRFLLLLVKKNTRKLKEITMIDLTPIRQRIDEIKNTIAEREAEIKSYEQELGANQAQMDSITDEDEIDKVFDTYDATKTELTKSIIKNQIKIKGLRVKLDDAKNDLQEAVEKNRLKLREQQELRLKELVVKANKQSDALRETMEELNGLLLEAHQSTVKFDTQENQRESRFYAYNAVDGVALLPKLAFDIKKSELLVMNQGTFDYNTKNLQDRIIA